MNWLLTVVSFYCRSCCFWVVFLHKLSPILNLSVTTPVNPLCGQSHLTLLMVWYQDLGFGGQISNIALGQRVKGLKGMPRCHLALLKGAA